MDADHPPDRPARSPFSDLVKLARDGDQSAKASLVDKLQRLVWHTIAEFGMSREDRQDVYAATFARLFEHLDTIRDPERLPGWIATTARNEAHTLLRARARVVVSDEMEEETDPRPASDHRLLAGEVRTAVYAAFRTLPRNCRELLRLLMVEPRPSYAEIGEMLGMPHGSIGPTRQRCLDRLRHAPAIQPFLDGGRP